MKNNRFQFRVHDSFNSQSEFNMQHMSHILEAKKKCLRFNDMISNISIYLEQITYTCYNFYSMIKALH